MDIKNENITYSNRIVFLDYLRIFAFVSVLLGHKFYEYLVTFSNDFTIHATTRFLIKVLLPLIQAGGTGVVLFFLISGYIITHVLQSERTGEFLIKRIFRIYPLYIVAVLIQYAPAFYSGDSPNIYVLLQQLFLVGDMFGTPYTLNGVEWTLRVEMLFYFYMAFLHSINIFKRHEKTIIYIYILTIAIGAFLSPIPSSDALARGYLTIYGPFLLLGSAVYLCEKRAISFTLFIVFLAVVFYSHFNLMTIHQNYWISVHFGGLGFLIFFVCWIFRRGIVVSSWALILADMTYAVYLFHNWFFEFIKIGFDKIHIHTSSPNLLALPILFITCYLMVKIVEKPGIHLGRWVLKYFRIPRILGREKNIAS